MITRSVALFAMLAVTGAALAQQPAPPAAPPHGHHQWKSAADWQQKMEQRRMDRLTVLLDLTPAQRQQVQAVLSDEHAKMRTAMQHVRQAMREARTAHEAARKDTVQKLTAVLSAEQMKKFKVLMPGRGMMRHGMMMHRMPMSGMDHDMDGPAPGPR